MARACFRVEVAIEVVLAQAELAAALGDNRAVVHVEPALGAPASSWRSWRDRGAALGADRELAAAAAAMVTLAIAVVLAAARPSLVRTRLMHGRAYLSGPAPVRG